MGGSDSKQVTNIKKDISNKISTNVSKSVVQSSKTVANASLNINVGDIEAKGDVIIDISDMKQKVVLSSEFSGTLKDETMMSNAMSSAIQDQIKQMNEQGSVKISPSDSNSETNIDTTVKNIVENNITSESFQECVSEAGAASDVEVAGVRAGGDAVISIKGFDQTVELVAKCIMGTDSTTKIQSQLENSLKIETENSNRGKGMMEEAGEGIGTAAEGIGTGVGNAAEGIGTGVGNVFGGLLGGGGNLKLYCAICCCCVCIIALAVFYFKFMAGDD